VDVPPDRVVVVEPPVEVGPDGVDIESFHVPTVAAVVMVPVDVPPDRLVIVFTGDVTSVTFS